MVDGSYVWRLPARQQLRGHKARYEAFRHPDTRRLLGRGGIFRVEEDKIHASREQ